MAYWNRTLSRIGGRRIIGGLGAAFVLIATVRGAIRLGAGVSPGNVAIVTSLIAIPGLALCYGAVRLPRTDVDPRFYATTAGWCLAGFAAMAGLLGLFHLQPDGGVSDPATGPPILTALGSVAGFSVGVHDGRAKTRTHELQERNRELERTQANLEESVNELEEAHVRLENANDRLERYRRYTDRVLDAVHDVFYVIDNDGSMRRWNESLSAVTGYTDAEIASMHALEFFDDDEKEFISTAIADAFEDGSAQVEADLFTKDGYHVPYEFAASTLENPDGDTVLTGIARDVSDRNERERELERRAQQQRVVADLGQFALETDDLDELMHEATRQVATVLDNDYCKVLDLDVGTDELLLRQGVGWNGGLVGEATVSAIEADSQAAYTLEHDQPIVVEDLETEARFGGPDLLRNHDVKSGISTIIGSEDDPWGILGTHDTDRQSFSDEDVVFVQSVANVLAEAIERRQYQGELERLVADLEESNERLEQFAYAASHDLQEPLRMVSSYLQLIDRRYDDELDEEGQEFLAYAVDGAERMRSMIDGLLKYSRVETGGKPMEVVDLDGVLEDVSEDLQVTIDASDATITTDSLPRVEGDPHQLRQVIQNLLTNAIEYSGDEPPRIHVSAERNGTDWIVSVEDEGIGIDPADSERVFEVFERAHDRSEGNGTGIGLALCERIVERHDGDIWVDSEPGEGTTFSFTLPAAGVRSITNPD